MGPGEEEYTERRIEYMEKVLDDMYEVLFKDNAFDIHPRETLNEMRIILTAYYNNRERGGDQEDLFDNEFC